MLHLDVFRATFVLKSKTGSFFLRVEVVYNKIMVNLGKKI